ncbi:hypothetical protein BC835DRAFT_164226 [Cytidiella melzeri]|nr:hypothetical protein BC835DRAFT_164226 [Cytidiella melzeri]
MFPVLLPQACRGMCSHVLVPLSLALFLFLRRDTNILLYFFVIQHPSSLICLLLGFQLLYKYHLWPPHCSPPSSTTSQVTLYLFPNNQPRLARVLSYATPFDTPACPPWLLLALPPPIAHRTLAATISLSPPLLFIPSLNQLIVNRTFLLFFRVIYLVRARLTYTCTYPILVVGEVNEQHCKLNSNVIPTVASS